jgi:hypothetical protein
MSPEARAHSLAKMKEYYHKHREKRMKNARDWALAHPEHVRARARADGRRKRGLHVVGGEKRVGTCPLCSKAGPLVPDHPFGIDMVRDWICRKCNMQLGQYEARESNGQHQKFREYLARFV